MTDELHLSGAAERFGLGESVELLGVTFTLRAHTNPELALYDSLAERHGLEDVAAEHAAYLASAEQQSESARTLLNEYAKILTERARLETKAKKLKADSAKIEALSKRADELAPQIEAATTRNVRLKKLIPRVAELAPQAEAAAEALLEPQEPERAQELSRLLDEYDRLRRMLETERVKEAREAIVRQSRVVEAEEAVYTEFVWRLLGEQGYEGTLAEFRKAVLEEDDGAYETVQRIVAAMGFPHPLAGLAHVGRRVGRSTGTASATKASPRGSAN